MNKTNPIIWIALVLLASVSCQQNGKPVQQDNHIYIKTHPVKQGAFPHMVRTSGKLASKSEMKLSFKTGGIINAIYYDEGDEVKKGQTLAELKFDEIYARVKQARLAYEKAKRDFERVDNLYRDSVATLEQFQDMQTAMQVAEANVKIAAFNLQHSTITAPEDGKILKRLAEENEMIAPGHPVFLFGTQVNDWIIKTNIVDKDLVDIALFDTAKIVFDAFNGKVFTGLVSQIGSMANPYTGTYEVEIRIINADDRFASGFIAKIDIQSKKKDYYRMIPINALVEGNENIAYIYRMVNMNPVKTKVTVHHFDEQYLYVTEGIQEKDTIIVDGAKYITKNANIKIEND